MKFAFLLFLALIMIVIHELGHYFAYKIFGIPACFRKSLIIPGVTPKETVKVTKVQGLVIALSGFIISTVLFVMPISLFYVLWKALLVGSIAGSIADFLWSFSMLFSKEVFIYSKNE